jgi:pyruvate formate lyase activating enzyme
MDEQIASGTPGRYWHLLEDGRIQCDLCPRLCKLHDNQRVCASCAPGRATGSS